jgi:HAD superfamily hydrolase (TIGR01509 family)
MIQALLFDLDGTIIDSELMALQAILDCTKEWGVPVSRDEAASVAGKKWDIAFDLLYSRHRMPLSRPEASQQIVSRYKELVHTRLRVVPGVVEAIRGFAGHFRIALVTGSHRDDALWALKTLKIDDCFTHILGAEDYPGSKPAPDGYLRALALLGLGPERALVFEDSEAGIAAARAAGVRVVAVTSTNHFGHDQSPADERIRDFTGIDADWVNQRFS